MGVVKRITPEELYYGEIRWIQDYARTSGLNGVAIGISGGKDSAVAAALCANALGIEKVTGYMLTDGEQSDIKDSFMVCDIIGIQHFELNIGSIHSKVLEEASNEGISISDEANINVAPRIRMMMLYAIAQSHRERVCGTGNLSESLVGYTTKWGDQACDFNPLGKLTSIEVQMLGQYMVKAPEVKYKPPIEIVNKVPADGLCGLSDEERLGVSYEAIHNYILGNMEDISKEDIHTIEQLEIRGRHKRLLHIPMYWPGDARFGYWK